MTKRLEDNPDDKEAQEKTSAAKKHRNKGRAIRRQTGNALKRAANFSAPAAKIACRLIPTEPGVAEPEDACFADFAEDFEQSDDIW